MLLALIVLFLVSIRASSREDATVFFYKKPLTNTFQSARPRGRTRPGWVVKDCMSQGFNPRVLAGGRDSWYFPACFKIRFQSARPRGRTRLSL